MNKDVTSFEKKRNFILQQLSEFSSSPPTLVAVTKRQPDELVDAALYAGLRHFGENRLQEAQKRWSKRRPKYKDLSLHFIGPLQTNKVEEVVTQFDVIQTLDRPKLAKAIASAIVRTNRQPDLLIQVNTGEESQKSGIYPNEFPDFHHYCVTELNLSIRGLMCLPPFDEPPAPHFALIAKLAEQFDLKIKSMGMSKDYEVATQLGATHIRIGTGLFGERLN